MSVAEFVGKQSDAGTNARLQQKAGLPDAERQTMGEEKSTENCRAAKLRCRRRNPRKDDVKEQSQETRDMAPGACYQNR